jgi:hypothetical protein
MRMQVEENLACMGRRYKCRIIWWESKIERDYREDLDIGGKMILRNIL